jgi:hypothetical protein
MNWIFFSSSEKEKGGVIVYRNNRFLFRKKNKAEQVGTIYSYLKKISNSR